MDKKIAGLVGAVSLLVPAGAAQALPAAPAQAQSFAELLAPIPDATQKLEASDAMRAERGDAARIEQAQYHHHHHHQYRRHYHHHHHHYRY